jgi:endonuclease YncB( thermonuclease family)
MNCGELMGLVCEIMGKAGANGEVMGESPVPEVCFGSTFVNAELVQQGYAHAYTYPPDVKYNAFLLGLQQEARNAHRGLWGAC